MLARYLFASAVLVGLGTSHASASCSLNGNYYPVGTVLCFDTFIQECTVAGYWKAIGNCRADDPRFDHVEVLPKIEDRLNAIMASAEKQEAARSAR